MYGQNYRKVVSDWKNEIRRDWEEQINTYWERKDKRIRKITLKREWNNDDETKERRNRVIIEWIEVEIIKRRWITERMERIISEIDAVIEWYY